MTEIYQISPEASLEGLRRALGQWRGKRVALVLPDHPDGADGWTELDNVARLRLLQRQAIVQGVELALITGSRPTRKAAKQVGIPVFRDVEAAANRNWRMDPLLPPVDVNNPARDLPEPPPWRKLNAGEHRFVPYIWCSPWFQNGAVTESIFSGLIQKKRSRAVSGPDKSYWPRDLWDQQRFCCDVATCIAACPTSAPVWATTGRPTGIFSLPRSIRTVRRCSRELDQRFRQHWICTMKHWMDNAL